MMMSEPRRLHPVAIVLNIFRFLREMIVPLIISVSFYWRENSGWFLVGTILLVSGLLMWAVISWFRYQYRIEEGELRIEYGVLIRKKRYIRQERIQSLNTSSGVIQRLFGVVKVQVETAGNSGESEAMLSAITRAEAEALRETLLFRSDQNEEAPMAHESVQDETNMAGAQTDAEIPTFQYKLSTKDLLIAASTSGRLGVVLSAVIAIVSQLDQFLPKINLFALWSRLVGTSVSAIIILVLFVAIVSWLLSIVGTILQYAGFTITRQGDDIYITRGFFEQREQNIPLHRVQSVRIVEGILRQPFGFVTLYVESAGLGTESGGSTILFPLLSRDKAAIFLEEMVPGFEGNDTLHPLPKRSLPRYMIRMTVPVLIVAIPVTWYFTWGFLSLLVVPIAILLAWFRYLDAGWSIKDDTVMLRFRLINRTTAIVPKQRIQSAHLSQTLLQRRKDLATFQLNTASGMTGVTFRVADMEKDEASQCFQVIYRY